MFNPLYDFFGIEGYIVLERILWPEYNSLLLILMPRDLLVHVLIDSSTQYLAF